MTRCYIATMATDKEFIETVIEKLRPLEITAEADVRRVRHVLPGKELCAGL